MQHTYRWFRALCGSLLVLYALAGTLPAAAAAGPTSTAFFTISRATYDAWGANGQYPVPQPTVAFPSGTTIDHVAFYFEYQGATPKVSTYAIKIFTDAGKKAASDHPGTLDSAAGSTMVYLIDSKQLADGVYHAILLLNGNQASSTTFTVGVTNRAGPGQAPTSGADPVVAVTGGFVHSLALLRDGTVYAWGDNSAGELGSGTLKSSAVPVRVQGLPAGDPVLAITSNGASSFALLRSGAVYAWGSNNEGQLGLENESGTPVPAPLQAFPTMRKLGMAPLGALIAGGLGHTLLLGKDGHVYAWGDNTLGEVGTKLGDHLADGLVSVPVASIVGNLGASDPVIGLAGGFAFSLALTRSGKVYAWGGNQQAQLGTGNSDSSPHYSPVQVQGLPPSDPVIAVTAGAGMSAALTRSGAVYAWGTNDLGALGNGSIVRRSAPVRVHGLPAGDPVAAVSCGPNADYGTCLALTHSGLLYAWGANNFGQLGLGTVDTKPHAIAAKVQGLPAGDPVVSIDATGEHCLAVTRSGLVYAWGNNSTGELGNGTTRNSALPVLVQLPHAAGPERTSTPTASPTQSTGTSGSASITIGNIGLAHQVNGQMQYTDTLHQGEQGTFYAPYTVTGAGSQKPTGTLTLTQNGRQIVSEPMQLGAFSDGAPNMNAAVFFSTSHPAGQITATITLHLGSATATKTYTFTLAAAV